VRERIAELKEANSRKAPLTREQTIDCLFPVRYGCRQKQVDAGREDEAVAEHQARLDELNAGLGVRQATRDIIGAQDSSFGKSTMFNMQAQEALR
jgi:hypothetical protein